MIVHNTDNPELDVMLRYSSGNAFFHVYRTLFKNQTLKYKETSKDISYCVRSKSAHI